ncbi:MAG: hypothetical protein ACRD0R_15195 [Acidimicrobiales bacterium]
MLGHRPRLAIAALVAVFALVPTACGGEGNEDVDRDDPTTTPPAEGSSTTTTAPSVEAEVEAAYLAYWEMAERLTNSPDPDDPEISQRAIGTALTTFVDSVTTLKAQGQAVVTGQQTSHDITSIELSADVARLRDCNVDDAKRVETSTGNEIVEAVATNLLAVELLRSDGSWLVSSIKRISAWEGATQCD